MGRWPRMLLQVQGGQLPSFAAPATLREHVDVTSTAGYSGTPLHRKLGVKPETRVLLSAAPPGFALDHVPGDAVVHTRAAGSSYDVVVAFCPDLRRLERRFVTLVGRLDTAGALWVAWPKRASGCPPDLDENVVREVGLEEGLV